MMLRIKLVIRSTFFCNNYLNKKKSESLYYILIYNKEKQILSAK